MSDNPTPGTPATPGEGSQDPSQSFGSASAAPGGYGPPPSGQPAGGPAGPPPGTPSFGSASAAPPPAGPPPAGPPPAGPGGPGGYGPGGPDGPAGPGGYGPGGPAGPGGPGGYGGPQPGWGQQPQSAGFFGAFFDFSFSRYVSLTFAKLLFIIATVIAALWWLMAIISGFGMGSLGDMFNPYGSGDGTVVFGVLAILFGWIPPALFLIAVRVGLEFTVATIKTAQNTSVLVERE